MGAGVLTCGGATAVDFGAVGAALRGRAAATLVSGAGAVAGVGAADVATEGVGAGTDA
jgi:hypothetical protein